jgi:SurA N-terminal domain
MLSRPACIALAVLALAACGGSSSNTLARVGDQKVTTKQVNALVDEVINQLRLEGKAVPAHGSKGEKALERQALVILVGRARLEQKAADLGVKVSNEEVLKRVGAGSTAGGEQEGNADFVASQARAQLLYEKLFARVTGGIKVTDAEVRRYYEQHRVLYGSQTLGQVREGIRNQLVGERRNAAMKRWLAQVTRDLPVR